MPSSTFLSSPWGGGNSSSLRPHLYMTAAASTARARISRRCLSGPTCQGGSRHVSAVVVKSSGGARRGRGRACRSCASFLFFSFFFVPLFFSPRAVNVNPADPSTGNFGICEGWRYFSLAAGFPLPAGYSTTCVPRQRRAYLSTLAAACGLILILIFCLSVFLNFKSGFLFFFLGGGVYSAAYCR